MTGVLLALALTITPAQAHAVAVCKHRAAEARAAHQPTYARAWAREAERARRTGVCRNAVDGRGHISLDGSED